MTEDDKSVFRSILDHISGMDYIKPEDLPNIDLYMDQVTTFMEDQLASTKRHEDDKIHQLIKNVLKDYRFSSATFQDADEEDQEFLKRFSFICLMSFDVYIKKMIIEKMIDDISPAEDKSSKKTKEK